MSIVGKIILGILGLCILLPGLCFGLFGLSVIPTVIQGHGGDVSQGLLLVFFWLLIAALLVWAAVAIFRRIGK